MAPPRTDPPRVVGAARWALPFVALALVALAVVPFLVGRRAREFEREAVEVLEPAGALSARIGLIQARQMSRFQAFLLTGDGRFRRSYQAALREEQDAFDALQRLVAGMDLSVRVGVAALWTVSQRWHVGHRAVFESDTAVADPVVRLREEERRYDELQAASLELERAIQAEVDAGRRRRERARRYQTWITLALTALALGATLVLAWVGRQLQVLTIEAEARRRDAVAARREIDALLEATGDGVLGMDLSGRCTSLNRAGRELLGYTEEEMRGRDVHDTIHHTRADGTPRPRESCPILSALGTRRSVQSGDDVLFRRRGIPFPTRWSLRPLIDGTEIRGAVLTFTDMTEVREKEDALRRAIRARDEVVSIVSHDLRNPLGVVSGAAELLLDLPLDEAERRKQADIILRSARRMSRLIEDLLDVARIEAGAFRIAPTPVSVAGVLRELEEEFSGQASDAGIALEVRVPTPDLTLYADGARVLQALANLVGNALKFTAEGGTVGVFAEARTPEEIVLRVMDTGPGIEAEELAHLFDRFWQAERTGRAGSGLGLVIVRGIAEAHGGSVEVESEPGRGSTFSLVLPSVAAPQRGGSAPRKGEAPGPPEDA